MTWQLRLAVTRQEAAERCGLDTYPHALIAARDGLDKRWQSTRHRRAVRALYDAELKRIGGPRDIPG